MFRRMMGWTELRSQEGMAGSGGSGDAPPSGNPASPPPYPPPEYLTRQRMRKSPALASILSMLPGLGQVYVGYYAAGFRNVVIIALIITVLANNALRGGEALLGIFLAFFWCYQILDANRRAQLYNRAIDGGVEDPLPALGDARPGPVFGVFLIGLGVILLLETRFDFDFYWLRDWWPIFLIGAGGYITWKNLQERAGN